MHGFCLLYTATKKTIAFWGVKYYRFETGWCLLVVLMIPVPYV